MLNGFDKLELLELFWVELEGRMPFALTNPKNA
jgi:hypothetical protein